MTESPIPGTAANQILEGSGPENPGLPTDRRIAAWLFLFCSLLYLSTANGVLPYKDDVSMLRVTEAIAERCSVAVPAGTLLTARGTDGRLYSRYGIGQSLLGLPLYVAARPLRMFAPEPRLPFETKLGLSRPVVYVVLWVGLLSTAGTVALLFLSCRTLGLGLAASIASGLALGVGTFAWHYARTFMSEPPSMLTCLLAFFGLLRHMKERRRRWLLLSGLGAGFALLLRPPNVLVLAPLGCWLLVELLRARPIAWRTLLETLAIWTAPLVTAIAVVALYNYVRFGNVLETGYSAAAKAPMTPPWVGLFGLLLSPGKGLFLYAPVLVPAVLGWSELRRRQPAVAATVAAIAGIFIAFHAVLPWWWGGGVWGPRYLVVILPFLVLGLGALIDRGVSRPGRIALLATGFVSILVQIVSVLVPYAPYMAQMRASRELWAKLLWHPAHSPLVAELRSLVEGRYPLDLAPVYYQSPFLAGLQLAALVAALVVLGLGLLAFRRRPDARHVLR